MARKECPSRRKSKRLNLLKSIPQVAECYSKNTPTITQRANARLISIAPQMYEIIQKMQSDEAKALVRYMEKEIDHAD